MVISNFKVGIAGLGYWGKNQARVFDELGCLEGVYDPKVSRNKETNHYRFYDSLDQLIDNIDALVICTPANTHYKIAKKALARVDILVEKPIAMNLKEVSDLKKIQSKNKKMVLVGHQLHFHPAVLKMKELVKDGQIGKLKYVYSNRLNLGKIRPNENVLWSFAPHDISLILEFVNSQIKDISIQSKKVLNNKIEDTTLTLINFENGVKGHIFLSWIHPFKEQRFTLVGTNGSLVFSDTEEKKLILYKTHINKKTGKIEDHKARNVRLTNKEPLKEQAKYFLKCLDSRNVGINNIDHAYNVVSVLEESTKLIKKESLK